MYKVALGIEYDGTAYHGWQRQTNAASVQENLENAISKVANSKTEVCCAGRTDKGVHASMQVVHFETTSNRSIDNWFLGVNTHLPKDIRVMWVKFVDDKFHARFSALKRQYRYFIYNAKLKPAILRNNVTFYHKKLDCVKMNNAAQFWVGEHNFSSFKDSDCGSKTQVRIVEKITVTQKQKLIVFDITANSFLHHMVRNMVGTLLEIGSGSKGEIWAKDVLLALDRTQAGVTASAKGLYLVNVFYPLEYNLPSLQIGPWFYDLL